AKDASRGRGEITETGSDGESDVGLRGERICRPGTGDTEASHAGGMIPGKRTLARPRLRHGNAVALCEGPGRLRRKPIVNAAARDEDRRLCVAQRFCRCCKLRRIGLLTAWAPETRPEELLRIVVSLGLHVLRQRQGYGSAFPGVREHAHCLRQALDDLLR